MSGRRRQAGEGQRQSPARAHPRCGSRHRTTELCDEDRIVITGQPLTRNPQIHSTQGRTDPVADLRSEPVFVAQKYIHPSTVADPSAMHKQNPSPCFVHQKPGRHAQTATLRPLKIRKAPSLISGKGALICGESGI